MKVDIYNTDKKYSVIYADPPWTYRVWSGKGKTAANHYKCMKLNDIAEVPVPKLADKNCVVFLWATFPCLQEALATMKAWGFKYKTCGFCWVKRNKKSDGYFTGLGYWTRANAEVCLIGTKGHPKRVSRAVKQVVDARLRAHSQKPDEVRERIVELCGDIPRIELFARDEFDGWDCWGDEV